MAMTVIEQSVKTVIKTEKVISVQKQNQRMPCGSGEGKKNEEKKRRERSYPCLPRSLISSYPKQAKMGHIDAAKLRYAT